MTHPDIRTHEFVPLPTSLHDARIAVRNLPGAENYIPKDALSGNEIDKGADTLVDELLNELDAEGSRILATNNMGWSDAEAEEFFSHPERQPFSSKLKLSPNLGEKTDQLLTVGTYLRLRYVGALDKTTSDSDEEREEAQQNVRDAGDRLKNFFDFSVKTLFVQEEYDRADEALGIDPPDRRAGTIEPEKSILSLIETAARSVAEQEGRDWGEVYGATLAIIEGGNFTTAQTFLLNKNGDPVIRKTLQKAIETNARDLQKQIRKVQAAWTVDVFRMSMGLDWEMYLKINNYPDSTTVEDRLLSFLERPGLVAETLEHMRREAPQSYETVKAGGVANYAKLYDERAAFLNLPDTVDSPSELEEKKDRVWQTLARVLPLAFEDSPLYHVNAPTRIGATPRAVHITYRNREKQIVNIVILDPRETDELFMETTAHELGHILHTRMLKAAEDVGDLPERSKERVPDVVRETLAILVGDQARILYQEDHAAISSDPEQPAEARAEGEFRDLDYAILNRRQAPYALTQQAVRLEFETLWNQGVRDWELSEEHARVTIERTQPKVDEWYRAGVPIESPHFQVGSNLNVLTPDDGLRYMGEYLKDPGISDGSGQDEISEGEETPTGIKEAFEKRFGPLWLENPDARKVLLGLMVETGRNYDTGSYPEYILSADTMKLNEQLAQWGIDPNKC